MTVTINPENQPAVTYRLAQWRYFKILFVIIFTALLTTVSGCASLFSSADQTNDGASVEDKTSAQTKSTESQTEQSAVARPVTPAQTTAATINQLTPEQEQKWGIRVVALRSTMAGMMIDFRYKVLDAEKAAPLLDLNTQAYMVVDRNGAKLDVPHSQKIGALRQTMHPKKIKEGFDYFVLFGNPGSKYAKPGDKVAVVIGDFKAEDLVIQ